MTDLQSLLAQVQGATGPDREIDRQIMALAYVWDKRHIGTSCWDDDHDTCCPGARHIDNVWVDPITDKWRTTAIDGFKFTASIDAAIALANRLGFYIRSEPRFHIDGERVDFISHALRPRWNDWRPDDEWFDRGEARHADQALSALAALLKAKLSQPEAGGCD